MNAVNTAIEQVTEHMAIKQKQKATWEDGDYASFAVYMEAGAIEVLENWDIQPGKSLLDVACGSGQTAIPAARKGVQVTGVDIAENLITHARQRANKSRLKARFDVGDAEQLPYDDHAFDAVITMFGAMFAPHPEGVASEIARVLKPGGTLHMANWTPRSMPAQMFKAVSKIVPQPPGIIPPVLWGDESIVTERLQDEFINLRLTRKIYPQWQYPFDTDELVSFFRRYFGPVKRAFDAATRSKQRELHEVLANIYQQNSEISNGILTITGGEYLEVVATRR